MKIKCLIMKKNLFLLMVFFASFVTFNSYVFSKTLKLAVVVPQGTTWGKSLSSLADALQKNTQTKLKVYFGGVAGDEPDVLRKIRIGQFHGGIFTGKVLGDIFSDLRTVEIPFTFLKDDLFAKKTLQEMTPFLNEGLEKRGFINLGFYDLGPVYVVSTKKISNLKELRGVKIWSWEGDRLVNSLLQNLKLVSVPLSLTDVLSSLSTGVIDAAYAPPLGILALQWHTKIKYIIDFPTAHSIGALLVAKKSWDKIPKIEQKKILQLSQEFISKANVKSVQETADALEVLKSLGVQFISFPESDYKKSLAVRERVINDLKGEYLSHEALKKLDHEIASLKRASK